MYQRLFIGNKIVKLKEIDSTNSHIKKLISDDREVEGLVVITENQIAGRGQKGNVWESEKGKNLTFSIFFKPNMLVHNQFLMSKVISLGIADFLDNLGLGQVKIKWPNDIYCGESKISGILIENSIKENKIYHVIVGIGLNVKQTNFDLKNSPTSIARELGADLLNLNELLNQLLFFIEKRYLLLKAGKENIIDKDYLSRLYWFNEPRNFKINEESVRAIIVGIDNIGKLQVKINNEIRAFDLKEIEFLV